MAGLEIIKYTNVNNETIEIGHSGPFLFTSKEGFSAPETRFNTVQNYGKDGYDLIDLSLESRDMAINGFILSEGDKDFYELRIKMISTLNPKITGTLSYTNDYGEYSIDVIPIQAPLMLEDKAGKAENFRLLLTALDPYWTDKSEIDAEIPMARIEPFFSFPLNITNTFEFAQLIAGDVIEIQNNGHVSVGAVFTINVNGPLVNPRLYNVITQEYFALKGTFMTGSILRISTVRGKKKVEQNDGDGWFNIMTKRKVESKFLQIDRGINYLQLQADSGVNFTTSYIKFEPKILGV